MADPYLIEYCKGSDKDKGQNLAKGSDKGVADEDRIRINDDDAGTVMLSFSLPAGSFATALLRELTHNDDFI